MRSRYTHTHTQRLLFVVCPFVRSHFFAHVRTEHSICVKNQFTFEMSHVMPFSFFLLVSMDSLMEWTLVIFTSFQLVRAITRRKKTKLKEVKSIYINRQHSGQPGQLSVWRWSTKLLWSYRLCNRRNIFWHPIYAEHVSTVFFFFLSRFDMALIQAHSSSIMPIAHWSTLFQWNMENCVKLSASQTFHWLNQMNYSPKIEPKLDSLARLASVADSNCYSWFWCVLCAFVVWFSTWFRIGIHHI